MKSWLDRWGKTVAVVVVIAVGVWLRLLGTFAIELWADEAMWATKLLEGNFGWIRPAGYMWLTRALLELRSDEPTLRSLSLLAAIAQLPLMFLLMRRLVAPWIAVAATFLLAVHPVAVGMAKEFKPYALESCLHTALLLLAVSFLETPRTRTIAAIAVVAALTPPFAWTPVFLFPGLFLAVGLVALRARNRAHIGWAVGGVVVTLIVLAGIVAVRLKNANTHPEFWGASYDVFFLGDGAGAALRWNLQKTAELIAFGARARFALGLTPAFEVASVLLFVVGVAVVLWKRGTTWALLLVSPWCVFLAFNLAGQWPYGVFRTNLFVVAYVIPLVAIGAHELWSALSRWNARAGTAAAVVVVALLACALPLQPGYFTHKARSTLTADASVRRALRALRAVVGAPSPKIAVAFDGQACSILRYYLVHHTEARAELGAWAAAHVEEHCSTGRDVGYRKMLAELVKRDESFWLIIAKRANRKHTAQVLATACTSRAQKQWRGTELFWCGKGDDAPPALP